MAMSCVAQQQQTDTTEVFYHPFFAPCFLDESPKIINLPDSFDLKNNNQYALFIVSCYFDSSGKVFEISPQQIYVKNKTTNELEKKYTYWEGWENKSIKMMKEEALKYSSWAKKELLLFVRYKHIPAKFKCTEKITNRNVHSLTLRLE